MSIKLIFFSLFFQEFLFESAVSAIYMPDCSKKEHKKKPQCVCKNPANWHFKVCEDWWHKPDIEESVEKMTRIVGGDPAPNAAYPWFARLVTRSGGWWGCGGMLIAKEYVLTAAHCVNAGDASSLAVEIGAVCPYTDGNCGQPVQTINILSVQQHPNYNSNTLNNDFALLKLSSRANAEPVPIDQGNIVDNYSSDKDGLWAIGFGTLSSGGNVASELRHVELSFVPRTTCNSQYSGSISNNMMCAADPGQDSCQGDSGGPLYDQANNALVGVVSWGYGCADPNYPGVYAQVSTQFNWIKSNTCGLANHSNPQPDYCDNTPPSPTPTAPTPTAPTPTAPTPTVTTIPPEALEPCNDILKDRFAITVNTDNYGGETYFYVMKRNWRGNFNKIVYYGDYFNDNDSVTLSKCLRSDRCYKVEVYDAYGDGMCCQYGEGSFNAYWSKALVQNVDEVFDNGYLSETETFGNC